MSDTIKTYVRFKPYTEFKDSCRSRDTPPGHYDIDETSQTVDIIPQKLQRRPKILENERSCKFSFDHIFSCNSSQSDLFNHTIPPIIDSVLQGYNASIICYGQTGSGKTYTMMGDEENPGIIPRLFTKIFEEIDNSPDTNEYTIALSYFEIYNDIINDLLNPNNNINQIYIREIIDDSIYVEGLEKIYIADNSDINQILEIGNSNRTISETKMNISSSRSHSILRVEININEDDKNSYTSTLFLVDLAGSERLTKSGTNSSQTSLKETIGINSSLSALGNVIKQLSENKKYVSYRDSKLTRVLANSLGGNSKTAIFITCSSDLDDFNETLSSLRFGQRAKNVHNVITQNRIKEMNIKQSNNIQLKDNNIDNIDQISENSNDNNEWKLKYVAALKKIIELESIIESPDKLMKENDLLREELNSYKEQFKNEMINQSIDYITLRSLQSLKSDIELYKKLLVTKTDKIIELEEKIEKTKCQSSFKGYDSINTMRTMYNSIQSQNDELLEKVEEAKRVLKSKEDELENANSKWYERDSVVNEEQNEVEKKLERLSSRLKSAIHGNETKDSAIFEISDIHDITTNTTTTTTTNNNIGKKGVNLRIVKPRE